MTDTVMRYVCGECDHNHVGVRVDHQEHYDRHRQLAAIATLANIPTWSDDANA